jgi:hypothetical protein
LGKNNLTLKKFYKKIKTMAMVNKKNTIRIITGLLVSFSICKNDSTPNYILKKRNQYKIIQKIIKPFQK